MQAIYLIRVGELALKGDNRSFFEKKLKQNIRKNLGVKGCRVLNRQGRFYVEAPEEHAPQVERALAHTFGIVSYSRASRVQKDMQVIRRTAMKLIQELYPQRQEPLSFKIEARRTDKSFPLNSYQIACDLGDLLREEFSFLRVDVHRPELKIFIEIREEAFLYGGLKAGLGGLPVGSAGRGMLMLSGGIDSPVAGYMMAKRGLKLDFIYFHTYPYTSEEALDKVKHLSEILGTYCNGGTLFVVPFTEVQLEINRKVKPEEITLVMRAAMVKIAAMAAESRGAGALITGEALSQVASQTIQSISFTGSATELPIFRPLIGLDKEEIIRLAREIETFETSILPYDDCCTIFSSEHPLLRPDRRYMWKLWEEIGIEELLAEAFHKSQGFYVDPIEGISEHSS